MFFDKLLKDVIPFEFIWMSWQLEDFRHNRMSDIYDEYWFYYLWPSDKI